MPSAYIQNYTKIAHLTGCGPILADGDNISRSVTGIGDLDRDGVTDLAADAEREDTCSSICILNPTRIEWRDISFYH